LENKAVICFPTLLYDSENYTITARCAIRITAEEIKYMRTAARYTWIDHKTNTEIAKN
jgi:hypothetical protein